MSARVLLGAVVMLALAACATQAPEPAPTPSGLAAFLRVDARQTQSPGDGWGAAEGPVTGGSGATGEHVYRVRTRSELAHALMAGTDVPAAATPKVIFIDGAIDLSVDANNRALVEADYRDPAFSWDDYARAFDPATWGRQVVEGPLEEARRRSAQRQQAVVVLQVGSNTSLIGIGSNALLKNGSLMVKHAENVIIRNIAFEDAYDYFPQWDPKDNAHGEWNSEYDNVTLYGARRVWIDRCTFSDGARPDRGNRSLFGRPMQFHDGLLDIVRGSDLVTISYSHFRNHDKGLLIGNSDSRSDDDGTLRVTMHHNWFENVKERSPRVRYGRVHLFNNLYTADASADYAYGYSIGVGYRSQIIAENNVFELPEKQSARVFKLWRGDRLRAQGNLVNRQPFDAVALLRAQAPHAMFLDQVSWSPPYRVSIEAASTVSDTVRRDAGAGRVR